MIQTRLDFFFKERRDLVIYIEKLNRTIRPDMLVLHLNVSCLRIFALYIYARQYNKKYSPRVFCDLLLY